MKVSHHCMVISMHIMMKSVHMVNYKVVEEEHRNI